MSNGNIYKSRKFEGLIINDGNGRYLVNLNNEVISLQDWREIKCEIDKFYGETCEQDKKYSLQCPVTGYFLNIQGGKFKWNIGFDDYKMDKTVFTKDEIDNLPNQGLIKILIKKELQ